jgi:hypothetical protein
MLRILLAALKIWSKARIAKFHGHELDHGPDPRHRRAHAQPREPELGDRRVHHPRLPELLQQPL